MLISYLFFVLLFNNALSKVNLIKKILLIYSIYEIMDNRNIQNIIYFNFIPENDNYFSSHEKLGFLLNPRNVLLKAYFLFYSSYISIIKFKLSFFYLFFFHYSFFYRPRSFLYRNKSIIQTVFWIIININIFTNFFCVF